MSSRRSMALSCSLLGLALACSDTPDTYTINSRPKGDQLAVPTGLVATAGSGNVKLQWNPVSGATSYEVYRATGAATAPYALIASTGLTTYRDICGYDNVLSAETPYYYRIMAKTNTGYDGTPTYIDSAMTDPVAATMASVPARNAQLAAPTVTLTDVNAVRYVTWTEVPNATAYDVYLADTDELFIDQSTPIFLFSALATNVTGLVTSHPVTVPSTRYAYVVVARKGDSYYLPSPMSALVFNDVVFRLATPAAAASSGTYADKIVVEWNKVPNATTYRVYRAESRTATSPDVSTDNVVAHFELVADLTSFTTSQGATTRLFVEDTANDLLPSSVENGIAVNRYYWYRIQAVGNATWADSFPSAAVQGTLKPDGQIPYSSIGVPEGVHTFNDGVNAFVTVRWQAVLANAVEAAAVSYDVYRAKGSSTLGFTKIASAVPGTPVPALANELEYQDTSAGLERGAVYYYRIVARGAAAGLESDLSAAGGPGFVVGLDPFTAFAAVKDGSNDLLFTWSPIRNVASNGGTAYSIRYVTGTTPPANLITGGTTVLNVPAATSGLNSFYYTGFAGAPFVAGTDYLFWIVATGESGQQVASATVVVRR